MTKRKKSPAKRSNLPGTIYQNQGSGESPRRWWWKVQLPGESAPKARSLKIVGSHFATTDYAVAVEIAKHMWEMAIFQSKDNSPFDVTNIATLVKAYLEFVRSYYKDAAGKPNAEPRSIGYSIKPLLEMYATVPIEEFGPLKLISVRDRMIELNWSRKLINQRIGRIKRMFKWGVCRQIVSPVVYHGLMAVEGLKRGRTSARETEKVKPVDEKHVYAVLPYTTQIVATMIELQLITGMRPGELVIMRPCDIDRSGDIWHYCPQHHKTEYRNAERIISIGPRGQEILRPFLLRPADNYCFSPAESEQQRLAKRAADRKTSLSYGNRPGTNRKQELCKQPGRVYNSHSYGRAVRHAITAARKAIRQAGSNPDKQLPYWTPYRMRHTAATKVRKEFGYESAGAALGHTRMSATAIYAERNQGLADEAARKFG